MQTHILQQYLATSDGQEANEILRACVHCGFCTATCPSYQLLGDELDGPRGRIYLIKQVLEGEAVGSKTQLHLDRCLTCRACETTCPSGVRYGRLLDIGRALVAEKVKRSPWQRILRLSLQKLIPEPGHLKYLLRASQIMRPLLPSRLKINIPAKQRILSQTKPLESNRRMLLLAGCVQSLTTPQTNDATIEVFNKLGIQLITAPEAGCCGAVSFHLDAREDALHYIKQNIETWWPYVEAGIEAIVITASGCGVMVKDYGELLKHDPKYKEKAQSIAALARDVSQVISQEPLPATATNTNTLVSFHNPCTLQHGQKINGLVEPILRELGYTLTQVENNHLCCGSAGTYSILQPVLSEKLLKNKITALEQAQPHIIVTANVGCQLHLARESQVPVKHWMELVKEALA